MKKLLNQISVLLIFFLFALDVNAQWCVIDPPQPPPQSSSSNYDSRNGWYLPPIGTIRTLVIFVEFDYTGVVDCCGNPINDPNGSNTPHWNVDALPDWKDDIFDANVPIGAAHGEVTRYYQQASYGQLNMIGDYLVAPTNGGIFKIPYDNLFANGRPDNTSCCPGMSGCCTHTFRGIFPVVREAVNLAMGSTFITGHGFAGESDFDMWENSAGAYLVKGNVSNNKYDYVLIILRNAAGYTGNGYTIAGGNTFPLLGYGTDTYTVTGSFDGMPVSNIRHEFGHILYGDNSFHTAAETDNDLKDYWIPVVGGWGNMGLYGASLLTWSGWDRQRMGWTAPGNTNNPAARDESNTYEVNGDLDASIPAEAGTYYLRDFVTTGDALRIKIPFINTSNEYPEYLWIENHAGKAINGSEFDQFQSEQDYSCVEGVVPGLYMQTQIDRDIIQSTNYSDVFNGYAMYLRPLSANGLYDQVFDNTTTTTDCVNSDLTNPFTILPQNANPLTGQGDLDFAELDLNSDGYLNHGELRVDWVQETSPGNYLKNIFQLGNKRQAFTLAGNHKLGIGTNPSSASMMNMVSYNWPAPTLGIKNLRKIYLNGLSVELLSQNSTTGDIKVQVRFDDIEVTDNVRWCADEIVLNPIATTSGYSLDIKSPYSITLDQGLTATRIDNPIIYNGNEVFVSPTVFHCESGSYLNMENNTTINLINGSTLHVKSGATLSIGVNSKIYVDAISHICIEPGAIIIFQDPLTSSIVVNGVPYYDYFDLLGVVLENNSIGNYHAYTNIVTGSNGTTPTTMNSSGIVELAAANTIILNPGTIIMPASSGNRFWAHIEQFPSDCSTIPPQRNQNPVAATTIDDNSRADNYHANINIETNSLFSLYPNPTKGSFHLAMNSTSNANEPKAIFIADYLGNEVLEKSAMKESQMDFDLSAYPKGVYMIKVVQGDKISVSRVVLM